MISRYALPHEREEVGRRINADTAEVLFLYAEVADPYGDGDLPEEFHCVGRMFFAVDPAEGVAVEWGDLPEATREALNAKRDRADQEGWQMLLPLRS